MQINRIYVAGTVRKDAVEIVPVEVPLTVAPILAAKYQSAWVPNRIRLVSVDINDAEGVPSVSDELDRLVRVYGQEHVAEAYGTKTQALAALTSLGKLTTAEAVAEAGIIPQVGDNAISVVAAPEKGTREYAQRAAAEAHPDDLKPVIAGDDAANSAATAKAQADAQQAEDDRRAEAQAAADQRRKDIADEAAALKANDVSADNSTKADMQAELGKRGVEYPASATKADLQELLDANPPKDDQG